MLHDREGNRGSLPLRTPAEDAITAQIPSKVPGSSSARQGRTFRLGCCVPALPFRPSFVLELLNPTIVLTTGSSHLSPPSQESNDSIRVEDNETLASESEMTDPSTDEKRLYDLNFVLAFASQTCFVIANTLMAHYARWIEYLGGSLSQIGWVMGAGAAAGLFLRPWLAQFINRMGAKFTWGFGYSLFSFSALLNCLLFDIGIAIYILRAATVMGAAMVFASSLTYISQVAPERRRTEAIGILGAGGFVGMLIGPLLGDVFLGSQDRTRADFLLLFWVAAVANVIPALLLYFVRRPELATVATQGTRHSMRISDFVATVRRYWPGRILLVNLGFGACMTVPFGFLASFVDEQELRIVGASEVGYFFLFYAGVGICFRVGLRKIPDQFGAKPVLAFGLVIMSLGMFSFALVNAQSAWLLAIPAVLCGVGHSLTFHTMTSLTIDPFPRELRGTGSALALMMLDLGMFAGAPILGLIGEYWGFAALFASVGAFCLLCTSVFLIQKTNSNL